MSDTDNKKTLGIKSTLKLGVKSGEKLSITPTASGVQPKAPSHVSSGKGKVVVVTKSHRVGRPNEGAANFSDRENDKRLQLLKQAALTKKLEEQKTRVTLHNKIEDEVRAQESEVASQEIVYGSEEGENEVVDSTTKDVRTAAPAPKRINLDDILKKGRVKNLDSMYKTPKPKQEEDLVVPEVVVAPSKPQPSKLQQPTALKAKKPVEDTEDSSANRKDSDRENRKISVAQVMMMEGDEGAGMRRRSLASIRRAREKAKRKMFGDNQKVQEKIFREVSIPDFITVQELSNRMSEKTADVIKNLMKLGMMVTVNQSIDADTAELVVLEFGHKFKRVTEADIEMALLQKTDDSADSMIYRAPVVTIMGHVDHGKTSLLDALRNTDVAAGEAGGITQHIGAYRVTLPSGKSITFLDTPGHEAFTAMRMRGAKVTDIVVLVVAADDGIMQQTIEAISHAKAAGVPIIVAINKIDKPEANAQRVKNELFAHGIVPEDMGGDSILVEVSAKQKINLDKLEEAILLQAEFLDLKANPNRLAEGAVVEAKVEKGRGSVATILIQRGTIRVGDIAVAGTTWGKVRALVNDKGVNISEAGPSIPVEVLGLETAPVAGDECVVVQSEKTARDLVSLRQEREKQKKLAASKSITLDSLFKKAQVGGLKELPIIIKADVQGSVEAIANSLMKLATDEIAVRVLHSAVGGITESDITLASASSAIIIGFNVRANQQARDMAKVFGIDIKYYSIIYNLVDDIKAAMGGMLSPVRKENITGYVDVREVFDLTKFGKVAGCYVTEGMIKRTSMVRLIRDSVVVYEGKLKALKRFKEDAKEVNSGFECGISFENYEDIKAGDKIEAFDVTEHARTI